MTDHPSPPTSQGADSPRTWGPGDVMTHRLGGTVTLDHRKDDDSGWWNTDGSGLDDHAALCGDWSRTPYRKMPDTWERIAREAMRLLDLHVPRAAALEALRKRGQRLSGGGRV